MFYARQTITRTRTTRDHVNVYAFANRRTRDMIVAALPTLEVATSRDAYRAKADERRDTWRSTATYYDMTCPEYWEDEFAPLFGDALRLGNFGTV